MKLFLNILLFSVSGFALSNVANSCIFMILYDASLHKNMNQFLFYQSTLVQEIKFPWEGIYFIILC
jgi:hypothetical protein